MAESSEPAPTSPSVRTAFLHRPSVPVGAVDRPDLLAALDHGIDRAATVITAPAGFGKTILVSQWCESLDRSVAWLSLDRSMNDVDRFMLYLVSAVRTVAPHTFDALASLIESGLMPEGEALVTAVANELDEIDEPIVLVLDDFHVIESASVRELVEELLTHPPLGVHLTLLSRRDPPLPIAALRAAGQCTELRMRDLAFTEKQLGSLLEQELPQAVDPATVRALHESTEGWPAGIRLTVEARRLAGGPEVNGVGFLDRATQEYLVDEVLHHVPADIRRYLVVASYFDRFSVELCGAAMKAAASPSPECTAREFVDWLLRNNLFLVSLDERAEWFRFHHLFGLLLSDWRTSQTDLGLDEQALRRTAAHVLCEDGLVEEAIQQLHIAGDVDEAIALTTSHGDSLIDQERWGELAGLLSQVPAHLADSDPSLLVLRAWLVGDHSGRHREMAELLGRAEASLPGTTKAAREQELRGEIAVLRGTYEKLNAGDFAGGVADSECARNLMSSAPGRHLSYAYALGAVSLANAGRVGEAHRLADSVAGDHRFAGLPFDPMLWMRPFLAWIEGDLVPLDRYGRQLISVGEQLGHGSSIGCGHYFVGTAAYERNDLATAEAHLSVPIDSPFVTPEFVLHSSAAMALVELAMGRADDARRTAEALMRAVLDARGEFYLPTADAFLALLNLREGHPEPALRWAIAADADPPRPRYMFFDQTPALIEILMSSPQHDEAASEVLTRALASDYGRYNRPINVKLLGLDAVRRARVGDEAAALASLGEAVRLCEQTGMVRSLADLGGELTPLLQRLDVADGILAHAGTILDAVRQPESSVDAPPHSAQVVSSVPGGVSLTDREMDVLRLLAARYTNREIAKELYIAPGTVKKRTVSLYDKLNVHGRREAVAKARILGYLRDDPHSPSD